MNTIWINKFEGRKNLFLKRSIETYWGPLNPWMGRLSPTEVWSGIFRWGLVKLYLIGAPILKYPLVFDLIIDLALDTWSYHINYHKQDIIIIILTHMANIWDNDFDKIRTFKVDGQLVLNAAFQYI